MKCVLARLGRTPGHVPELADRIANYRARHSACPRRMLCQLPSTRDGRSSENRDIINKTKHGVAATDETGVLSNFIRCLNRPQTRIQVILCCYVNDCIDAPRYVAVHSSAL
jgi:hypothetical protein